MQTGRWTAYQCRCIEVIIIGMGWSFYSILYSCRMRISMCHKTNEVRSACVREHPGSQQPKTECNEAITIKIK